MNPDRLADLIHRRPELAELSLAAQVRQSTLEAA